MAAPIAHGVRTVGVLGAGQMGPWNACLSRAGIESDI